MQQPSKFIFLVGRPGSGTTTHGNFLKNMVNRNGGKAAFISIGDLCRDAQEDVNHRHHDLIISSGDKVNGGGLVDDDKIHAMITEEMSLAQQAGVNTFIFSGYPRTFEQVRQIKQMEENLAEGNQSVEMKYVHLEIDREGAISRIKERRAKDKKVKGDAREDDKDNAKILERQLTYEAQTELVISFLKIFRKHDLIIESTQTSTPEAVHLALGLRLNSFLLGDIDTEHLNEFRRPHRLEY